MKYTCSLFVVEDIEVSRDFYENVLNQTVKYNFGENITFEGDFAIHEANHFANLITIEQNEIIKKANNSELYFEEENIDEFIKKLESSRYKITYIHTLLEHPWGQRVVRFYDPDMHIIEVGESMISVVRRFIDSGLSIEETSDVTQHPIEFVKMCLENRK